MASELAYEIVSPERLLKDDTAAVIVLPGVDGDFGVLAGHAPFMSTLRPGVIEVYETESGAAERFFVKGGLAHVGDGGLTILAEETIDLGAVDTADLASRIRDTEEDLRDAADEQSRHRISAELAWMQALSEAVA